MKFYNNFFLYVFIFFIILFIISSFYRFIIKHDYLVGYEGVCDTTIEKCFIGYEEGDSGVEEYYYSKMIKSEFDLYRECGKDITDCEAANMCLPEDRECSVTYCEAGIDDNICTTPIEESIKQNDSMIKPVGEEFLEDVNMDNTL